MMLFHSAIISIVLYMIMKYLLKQSTMQAMDRSILIGAFVLIYMILFGHDLPRHINKNIM